MSLKAWFYGFVYGLAGWALLGAIIYVLVTGWHV